MGKQAKQNILDESGQSDYDSDAEEQMMHKAVKRDAKNKDDKFNKLRLNEFHHFKTKSDKVRKPTNKKKLRDLERLLTKDNLPPEMVEAKKNEIKELKKVIKKKNEAEKFELKYKKIKFIEKRKVIRKLEQVKALQKKEDQSLDKADLQKQHQELRNQLTYIDNFPEHWKYISLFVKDDTEESKKQRDQAMEKVLQLAQNKRKNREQEIIKADQDLEMEDQYQAQVQQGSTYPSKNFRTQGTRTNKNVHSDQKLFGKNNQVQNVDNFFRQTNTAAATGGANQDGQEEADVEKRIVQRDGKIPKLKKNLEKVEQQKALERSKKEGWQNSSNHYDTEQHQQQTQSYEQPASKPSKDLKIKASQYRMGSTATNQPAKKKKSQLNIQF